MRRSTRISEWPWRQKVAIGAWVPVLIVALALFTGPNQVSSAARIPARPATVTTISVPPDSKTADELAQAFREVIETKEAVEYWIDASPKKLTLKQQVAKSRWRSERRKQLLGKHKAAVALSRHRNPPSATP